MTPEQREVAERLVADQSSSNLEWSRQVVALLRELLAEPQGEPVARIQVWWKQSHDGTMECHAELTDFEDCIDLLPEGEHLLYASPQPQRTEPSQDTLPQQRKPLTDDEALALIRATPQEDVTQEGWIRRQRLSWVRAIERAHGITGEPT